MRCFYIMIKSSCIGFCRSSNNKQLSETIENYLSGKINEFELKDFCKKTRLENIKTQKEHNVDIITSNDFAMYDHMLDATCLVGNIQKRYYWEGGKIPLDIYFSLTKGVQRDKFDVVPLELRNWLNTNYLYHVPEFVDPVEFSYSDNKPIVEFLDARSIGVETRSTIIAPITYLLQGKSMEQGLNPIELLEDILPVYQELFANYNRIGVKSISLEDPLICNCIDYELKEKYTYCYEELKKYAGDIELNLVPYYGNLRENFDFISSLPVNSIHIDVPYNKNHIGELIEKMRSGMKISVGVVDSRSVWKNNLSDSIEIVSKICSKLGEDNVVVATSSPLFLCPYSVKNETNLPATLKHQLSFAVEKLDELNVIKTAINCGRNSVSSEINENKKIFSQKTYDFIFKTADENKNQGSYESKWKHFVKSENIKDNPMFMIGNANQEIQDDGEIDLYSSSFTKENYNIEEYEKSSNGIYVCQDNYIPRFGTLYYKPTIIYDVVKIKENVFENCVANAVKNSKKPIKFSVCSPLHFINSSFVSPFVDFEKLQKSIFESLAQSVNKVAKNIKLLQINDFTITSNINLSNIANIEYIKNYCELINNFISKLKDIKCVGYCNAFCDLSDYIDYIYKINADIFITTSIRSRFNILNTFVKYRPRIPVAFGLIDPYGRRTTTKNEIAIILKKIFSSLERDNVLFTTDGDFLENTNQESVLKSIKNIYSALKEVCREIDKENKAHKHDEKEKENKKEKKEKKKTTKTKSTPKKTKKK